MKKILVSAVMASFLITSTVVSAQPRESRGNGGGQGSGRSNSNQPQRNFSPQQNSSPQQQRNFTPQPNRSPGNFTQQRNFNQQRNFTPQRNSVPQRNFTPQRDFTQQRNFTPQRNFSPQRNFGSQRNVRVQNNFYGSRNYVPRSHWTSGYNYGYSYNRFRPVGRYNFVSRPRIVVSIGGPFSTISFGGNPYNYYNGYWYRPYGSSFQLITPPIGIGVSTLPFGYSPVYGPWGTYYYYNNVFYNRPDNSQDYQVVDAPLGAQVAELPKGAEVRIIDAKKYYELDGVFYQEDLRDGQIWYTIVGKDGVLSTVDTTIPDDQNVGDRISVLPEGSKAVTINGQKLYAAPNGVYYQEVIDEDNNVSYEIIGQ